MSYQQICGWLPKQTETNRPSLQHPPLAFLTSVKPFKKGARMKLILHSGPHAATDSKISTYKSYKTPHAQNVLSHTNLLFPRCAE